MILIAEKLASTVALHSPVTEEQFSSLAREDSYTWKRVEEIMNDYRNKLGSNAILEYKVSNKNALIPNDSTLSRGCGLAKVVESD